MNTQSPEYQRVREEVAEMLNERDVHSLSWVELTRQQQDYLLSLADQILSLVAILADDQSLPINPITASTAPEVIPDRWVTYRSAQKDMLKANFRRVIKDE